MDDLAVAETRMTGHYLTLDLPCSNKQQAVHLLPIHMTDGEIIKSMHTALLSSPYLTPQARQAHLFPGLMKALLSIGKLCKHGCEATSNDKSAHIKNKQSGKTTMRGKRDARTNLYMLSLTQKKNLMTEPKTHDKYFAGSAYECKSKNT